MSNNHWHFLIFLSNIRFPLSFFNMQLKGHLPSKTRSRLVSTVAVLGSKTPRQVPTVSNSFFRKLPLQLLFLFVREAHSLFNFYCNQHLNAFLILKNKTKLSVFVSSTQKLSSYLYD